MADDTRAAGDHVARDDAADVATAEAAFVDRMDALQDYLALQVQLQEQLKQGVLLLTRAKYSMGPIGAAQYDDHMRAAVRIAATSESGAASASGRRTFSLQAPPAGSDGPSTNKQGGGGSADHASATSSSAPALEQQHTQQQQQPEASRSQDPDPGVGDVELELDSDDSADSEVDGAATSEEARQLREAHAFLRRMRMQAGEGGSAEAGGHGAGPSTRSGRAGGAATRGRGHRERQGVNSSGGARGSDPLQWFGVLVPPALKQAREQFAAAVGTALQLANTAQRIQGPQPRASSGP